MIRFFWGVFLSFAHVHFLQFLKRIINTICQKFKAFEGTDHSEEPPLFFCLLFPNQEIWSADSHEHHWFWAALQSQLDLLFHPFSSTLPGLLLTLCSFCSLGLAADNHPYPHWILCSLVFRDCMLFTCRLLQSYTHSSAPKTLYVKQFCASFARLEEGSSSCRCLLKSSIVALEA